MSNIQKRLEALKILENYYKNKLCAVDKYRDPYKVLISCIISLRTKDEVTEKASKRLFKKADNPYKMLKLKPEEISSLIYPAGFYRRKGIQIWEISKILVDKYNGEVPCDIEELLNLKGVGRKTANLVLSVGCGKPAICVDTHVHRISNRLGWLQTSTPEQTEFELMDILPIEVWSKINNLFVLHGKNICKPLKPLCNKCPIKKLCATGEENV